MKVIKKINNNIAVATDGNNREVIIFGKGIGFHEMPYELTDLNKIERSFYNINEKYYGLLKEIPENIFMLTVKLVDMIKNNIHEELNPNLIFTLADHINFAIQRDRQKLNLSIQYSYELEYEYPEIVRISKLIVQTINLDMNTNLAKGEISSIAMHIINALKGKEISDDLKVDVLEKKVTRIIKDVTTIVEQHFDIKIDKKSFNYFRFKNHIKYFVQRKEEHKLFNESNEELFEGMKVKYKDTYECIKKIDDYISKIYGESCTKEELLYLMIHINCLQVKK